MPLLSSGSTDVGKVRESNQDSIYVNGNKNIFLVADGMGGHNGGDIASQMAVSHISEYLLSNFQDLSENPSQVSNDSISYANKAILKRSTSNKLLRGMGTTAVLMVFKGQSLYIANVGDSRTYMVHKEQLFQLTKDHSLVYEKLNLGIYDRIEAQSDKMKNILVRTVGYEDPIEIDVFSYKVKKNDIFFSCSDGLFGEVSDEDILFIINKFIPDPASATQQQLDLTVMTLIEQAKKNGGRDNISVILVVAK